MVTGSQQTRRVFLSYAHADEPRASAVWAALEAQGLTLAAPEAQLDEDIRDSIVQAARTSDVVVLLLSKAASHSWWALWDEHAPSSTELAARGVTVIPVRLDHANFPPYSLTQSSIDLSSDFENKLPQLVQQVKTAMLIDFSILRPGSFVQLVADLLTATGFQVDSHPLHAFQLDGGMDLVAKLERDAPLGMAESETWFVVCKLYKSARVSVGAIRQLVDLLTESPVSTRGLLVTSARLTSVAQAYLEEAQRVARVRVAVVDSDDLVRLLRAHPPVVEAYFGEQSDGSYVDH